MQAMTELLRDTLLRSHRRAVQVLLVYSGLQVADLTSYVTGGTVTVRRGAVQRTVDLTLDNAGGRLADAGLLDRLRPRRSHDLLVRAGAELPGQADPELIGQGLYRITAARPGSDQTLQLTGMDYGWVINRARFETPYPIAAGSNYASAMEALLRARYPLLDQVNLPTTTATTPTLLYDEQGEPWTAAQRMGDGLGWIVETIPDTLTPGVQARQAIGPGLDVQPVWSFSVDDGELSALVSAEEDQDVDGVYNVVVATGEAAGDSDPPRATAEDLDPGSDTYTGGSYGRVPTWYSSPLLTSDAMAQQAAVTVLQRQLGAAQAPQITGLPQPALELGDIVEVVETTTGLNGRFAVDQYRLPLTGATMQLDLLAQVPVEVE